MLQAELEDKERKHFRTKGGSDFEGKLLMHLIGHFSKSKWTCSYVCTEFPDQFVIAAEQRQADLKLLEAPDIGTGIGGKPKVLVPKAVDADEEGDDDDESESDDDDDEVRGIVYATKCRLYISTADHWPV